LQLRAGLRHAGQQGQAQGRNAKNRQELGVAVAEFQGVLRQSGFRLCALAGAAVAVGSFCPDFTVGVKACGAVTAQDNTERCAVYAQTRPKP